MKSKLESVFKSKWKFRYFQLVKLPSLFFWGIKVQHIDSDRAEVTIPYSCLLYTSDAADERSSVDLGGRRIIKKKKTALT